MEVRFTPPLRKKKNQARWAGLKDDVLQVVSTDHCPSALPTRRLSAWATHQDPTMVALVSEKPHASLLIHHGVNEGRISLQRFVELTARRQEDFWHVPEKGIVHPVRCGYSDWDPEAKYTITAARDAPTLHLRRLRGQGQRRPGFSRGTLSSTTANSSAPSDAVGICNSRGAEA